MENDSAYHKLGFYSPAEVAGATHRTIQNVMKTALRDGPAEPTGNDRGA